MIDTKLIENYRQGYADGYADGSNYREAGCRHCAFEDVEEWEMPCVKCKRCCKDYYRRNANEVR